MCEIRNWEQFFGMMFMVEGDDEKESKKVQC